MNDQFDVAIVGAGFAGLAAGLELVRAGKKIVILECDSTPGGLAGTFEFRDGVTVEKFYHHWFKSDEHIPQLIAELGLSDRIVALPSRTGIYYNRRLWRLSTPLDLLRFRPLSLIDRVRLGLLVLRVRRITDWRSIEHLSIRDWLEPLCGKEAFRIVWEPLIKSKFSTFADDVNAVWMWKKLVLRGGTRDSKGAEELVYFRGGFGQLAQAMTEEITRRGGEVRFRTTVTEAQASRGALVALTTASGDVKAREFLFTPSFSIVAEILAGVADSSWIRSLRRVNYLGNICLVLELNRSLTDTYWLNVNDPGFPFVGVIEHTNFDSPESYQGRRIVFLSRYVAEDDPACALDDGAYFSFAFEHLKRMFPEMERGWVTDYRVWRARFAQPVTEKNYSQYVPGQETPFANALISTMAHVYPEDRGTNYAVREGRRIARVIAERLSS